MNQAPIARKALGSMRCPGCRAYFTDSVRDFIKEQIIVQSRARGNYKMNRTAKVTRLWHADCYELLDKQAPS